jgi:hypothetical protein
MQLHPVQQNTIGEYMQEKMPEPAIADQKQPQGFEPFEKVRKIPNFIRTTLRVLMSPRAFFTQYFHPAGETAKQQAPPLSIFDYLGLAIGFAALAAPLHRTLLRAGGFPESFLELAERGSKGLVENYERMTGRDLVLIDLTQLTGISLIDSPIEDIARMAIYALFAGLFWAFSGGKLPLKRMMGYFAYSIGACIVVATIFLLIGDMMFALLSSADSQTAFSITSGVHQIGDLPRLFYLFIMPAVIFPAIVPIGRGRVIVATILSVITWAVAGLLLSQIMLSNGVVIVSPGL